MDDIMYAIDINHNMGTKDFVYELKWLLRVYDLEYEMKEDDMGNYHFEIITPVPAKEGEI